MTKKEYQKLLEENNTLKQKNHQIQGQQPQQQALLQKGATTAVPLTSRKKNIQIYTPI